MPDVDNALLGYLECVLWMCHSDPHVLTAWQVFFLLNM